MKREGGDAMSNGMQDEIVNCWCGVLIRRGDQIEHERDNPGHQRITELEAECDRLKALALEFKDRVYAAESERDRVKAKLERTDQFRHIEATERDKLARQLDTLQEVAKRQPLKTDALKAALLYHRDGSVSCKRHGFSLVRGVLPDDKCIACRLEDRIAELETR